MYFEKATSRTISKWEDRDEQLRSGKKIAGAIIAPANNQITKFTLPHLAVGNTQNGAFCGAEAAGDIATREDVNEVGIDRRRRPNRVTRKARKKFCFAIG